MSIIKTIIFDFGDVFINLDKKGTIEQTEKLLGFDIINEKPNAKTTHIFQINDSYEKGEITTETFVSFYTNLKDNLNSQQVITLWNSLIKDFPEYRLEFIERLAKEKKYNLILLSNTNKLHIEQVIENMSIERYKRFKACFNKFYLSHEIHLRKPDKEIFEFVLSKNQLMANECLFIDDTKTNTDVALKLGINVWNNNPNTEDIIDLFNIKKELF